MRREDAAKLNGVLDGVSKYHPYMNPGSRASREDGMAMRHMLRAMRDGSLWRLCVDMDEVLTCSPCFATAISVWDRATFVKKKK